MIKCMHKNIFSTIVITIFVFCIGILSVAPTTHASCINISSNLSSGMTDSGANGPILTLQNYLKSLGYLSATPNGHFGPATLAAVKIYQTINNISPTGYVGPITIASIGLKTCPTGSTSVTPTVQSSNSTTCPPGYTCVANNPPSSDSTPSTPTTSDISSNQSTTFSPVTVTSPALGQVLSIGSSTIIRWSVQPSSVFNITLEQPGGAGAGFIAQSLSPTSGNQYVWKVGKVFSTQSNSYRTLPTGTYRIRLQSINAGSGMTDEVSGWFTIVAQQFSVSNAMPSSAYADNASAVVLFGSGFTTASSVYFDTNYSSYRANNAYVSPDGSILVFTIPTNVPTGSHTLYINNGISSTPATLPFTINSVQ